jgi:hypothetical protein
VITGAKPYDGRYEFDISSDGVQLNTREWGWIRRLADYYPADIGDGLARGDAELVTVFAVIALARAGRIAAGEHRRVFEQLAEAPYPATVTLEVSPMDAEDADAGPPDGNSRLNGTSSGPASTTSSETSASPTPDSSGTPASATSQLAPTTSAT